MIKVTELIEKREEAENIKKIEKDIDNQLLETSLIYEDKIEVILLREYSKKTRDIIAEKYKVEGGYSKVTHLTSSENGDKAGLTLFKFYF